MMKKNVKQSFHKHCWRMIEKQSDLHFLFFLSFNRQAHTKAVLFVLLKYLCYSKANFPFLLPLTLLVVYYQNGFLRAVLSE